LELFLTRDFCEIIEFTKPTVEAATVHHQLVSLDKQNVFIQVRTGLVRDQKTFALAGKARSYI